MCYHAIQGLMDGIDCVCPSNRQVSEDCRAWTRNSAVPSPPWQIFGPLRGLKLQVGSQLRTVYLFELIKCYGKFLCVAESVIIVLYDGRVQSDEAGWYTASERQDLGGTTDMCFPFVNQPVQLAMAFQ
jgi:hypothetical protein